MYKIPKRKNGGKQCQKGADGRGGAVAGQSLQAPPKFPASMYNKQLIHFLERRWHQQRSAGFGLPEDIK